MSEYLLRISSRNSTKENDIPEPNTSSNAFLINFFNA